MESLFPMLSFPLLLKTASYLGVPIGETNDPIDLVSEIILKIVDTSDLFDQQDPFQLRTEDEPSPQKTPFFQVLSDLLRDSVALFYPTKNEPQTLAQCRTYSSRRREGDSFWIPFPRSHGIPPSTCPKHLLSNSQTNSRPLNKKNTLRGGRFNPQQQQHEIRTTKRRRILPPTVDDKESSVASDLSDEETPPLSVALRAQPAIVAARASSVPLQVRKRKTREEDNGGGEVDIYHWHPNMETKYIEL